MIAARVPIRGSIAAAGLILWVAVACSLLLPHVAAQGSATIQFVSPQPAERVVGRGTIELRIVPVGDVKVDKVTVSVDGKRIATLDAPPWRTAWDAGDALEPRFLEAVAFLSDGTRANASTRTSPLRIDQYEEVSLVNVYAIARDAKGEYVAGLTGDEFRVTENDRPQHIDRFSDEWKPLRVAIVLDTSLSMKGEKLDAAREAALAFLETLRPEDQGMVVTFSDSVQVLQELTGNRATLGAAIEQVRASGGTALYDAVWKAADLLEPHDGRRVLVLLSDGRDEASSGLEPGSLHTQEEALDRALRSETMIFAIGFGKNLASEMDFFRRRSLEAILREMAEASGGRALFTSRSGKLRRSFQEVADDLRHQYSLAYTSNDPRKDGSWREIRVATTRPMVQVVARKGYFAPRDRAAPPTAPRRR